MAHGKTLELIEESRKLFWRAKNITRPTVKRDRSLNGKERIRARRDANKASRIQVEETISE